MISLEEVKRLVNYDPASGLFFWTFKNSNHDVGTIAGRRNSRGYIRIKLLGKDYYAHRLAFLFMTGVWPKEVVDHKNGRQSDNRWTNLREATQAQNVLNSKVQKNNKSGFKGVYEDKRRGTWFFVITSIGNKTAKYGFESALEAFNARKEVLNSIHGDFANDGTIQ